MPPRRLRVDDAAHALRVERLEVEPGRGVEVGRDGLGVRVDHHRPPAVPAQRVGGLDRAVVELDALADADRPRADDERRRALDRRRLRGRARGCIGRIEVRRLGRELRGARVDHRVARHDAERESRLAQRLGVVPASPASSLSPKPARLTVARSSAASASRASASRSPHLRDLALQRDVAAHLGEEPGRDAGRLPDDVLRDAAPEQAEEPPQPRVGRLEEPAQDERRGRPLRVAGRFAGLAALVDPVDRLVGVGVAGVDAGQVVERRGPGRVLGERADAGLLEPAERLVQRGAERPVDGHHLARRLHLAAERPVGRRELVEREARQLDDDVVEGGLEGGDGRAGHDVGDLGQPPPDGDLGRDPGDRVAGGLARERGRARDARVDLDDRVVRRVRARARTGRCSRPRRRARG